MNNTETSFTCTKLCELKYSHAQFTLIVLILILCLQNFKNELNLRQSITSSNYHSKRHFYLHPCSFLLFPHSEPISLSSEVLCIKEIILVDVWEVHWIETSTIRPYESTAKLYLTMRYSTFYFFLSSHQA